MGAAFRESVSSNYGGSRAGKGDKKLAVWEKRGGKTVFTCDLGEEVISLPLLESLGARVLWFSVKKVS